MDEVQEGGVGEKRGGRGLLQDNGAARRLQSRFQFLRLVFGNVCADLLRKRLHQLLGLDGKKKKREFPFMHMENMKSYLIRQQI